MDKNNIQIRYFLVFLFLTVIHSQAVEDINKSVLIIAHRGSTGENIPENTMAAFRESVKIGVDLIELDLRGSRDGHIMIMHDASLERTTNGSGKLKDHTLAELKELDAGEGESIPTFEEVLSLIGGTGVHLLLDIKLSSTLSLESIVELTEKYNCVLNIIAGVRTIEDLVKIKNLNPNIRTLGFISSPDLAEEFINSGADIIRLWPKWIDENPDVVSNIHNFGKPVWSTCTSNTAEDHQVLIKTGIDGILTDYPKMAKNILKKSNLQ